MSLSDLFGDGLSDRRERAFAVATLAAGFVELLAAFLMIRHSTRFDVAFLAERDARRVLAAAARPMPLQTWVDVGLTSPGRDPALLEGWSAPERDGVWTDGRTARLALGLQSMPGSRLSVLLRGYVLAPSDALQDIVVETEGAVGRWALPSGPATLTLPLKASSQGTVVLTLLIGRPARPSRGGDPRALGFSLQAVKVVPDR